MFFKEFVHDKCRRGHADPECFCFIAARNRAAIVIRQHDHRTALQFWIKNPFTGTIKIIAIHECVHNVELSSQ